MVYSDFLSFNLMSFFCFRISPRVPHYTELSCLLRQLLAVTISQAFLGCRDLQVLRGMPLYWNVSDGFLMVRLGTGGAF